MTAAESDGHELVELRAEVRRLTKENAAMRKVLAPLLTEDGWDAFVTFRGNLCPEGEARIRVALSRASTKSTKPGFFPAPKLKRKREIANEAMWARQGRVSTKSTKRKGGAK